MIFSNRYEKQMEVRQYDLRLQQNMIESESRRFMEVWCQYNEERVTSFKKNLLHDFTLDLKITLQILSAEVSKAVQEHCRSEK